jgi:signal transduction histidine kinase
MKRRRSLRAQLTVLYAGPFFLTGAMLLTFPILTTRQTVPANEPTPPPTGAPDVQDDYNVVVALVFGVLLLFAVSVVLGWLVAGRFLRPLRTMTATARDISASNLHRRLGRTGRDDEFTELAATLDDLFQRLESSFEAQRRFVANASHELRTPLAAERTLLQVALADPNTTVESLRAACHDVLALGVAQERLIDALLTLASSERGIEQREPFDLAEIAATVLLARDEDARRCGVRVDRDLALAPATGDRDLVESLVANLVDNAIRYNHGGGWVEVTTAVVDRRATVTVRNTGVVVPPDDVARLFQPFQRLGGERLGHADGHGLGLAIVNAIAGAHGATVAPQALPDGGLAIAVSFPGPDSLGRTAVDG